MTADVRGTADGATCALAAAIVAPPRERSMLATNGPRSAGLMRVSSIAAIRQRSFAEAANFARFSIYQLCGILCRSLPDLWCRGRGGGQPPNTYLQARVNPTTKSPCFFFFFKWLTLFLIFFLIEEATPT